MGRNQNYATRQINASPPPNARDPITLTLTRRMPRLRLRPFNRRIINKCRPPRDRPRKSRKSRSRSTLRSRSAQFHQKYILVGLVPLILGTLAGLGKSVPPAFHKSNVLGRDSGLRRLGPTLTLCVTRGVCSTGPYLRRKLARLAPLAP